MATTTAKRITIAFTKEDMKQIETLCNKFGETPSDVLKRALMMFHYLTFNKK